MGFLTIVLNLVFYIKNCYAITYNVLKIITNTAKKLDVIIRLEAFLSLYIETAAGCTTNREDIGNQMREETLEHLDAFFKMVGVTPALQSITELGISVFCFFGEV